MGHKLIKRHVLSCRKSGDGLHKGYFTDDGKTLVLRCWRCGAEIYTDSEFAGLEEELEEEPCCEDGKDLVSKSRGRAT